MLYYWISLIPLLLSVCDTFLEKNHPFAGQVFILPGRKLKILLKKVFLGHGGARMGGFTAHKKPCKSSSFFKASTRKGFKGQKLAWL